MRTSTSRTAALTVGGLVAALALGAAPATASDPGESTLTGPAKAGTVTSSWTGSIAQPGFEAPSASTVDTHALTVKAPGKGKKAASYFAKNTATLDVVLTWDGPYNDLDLNVYDANGTEVATSGNAPIVMSGEAVSFAVGAPGTYTVEVVSYLAEPGVTYDATATLTVGK